METLTNIAKTVHKLIIEVEPGYIHIYINCMGIKAFLSYVYEYMIKANLLVTDCY